MTPEEYDLIVRTLYGEAQTDPDSQAAVAHVILNRAKQSGKSVKDVVLSKHQFEPWNTKKGKQKLLDLDKNSEDYKTLAAIVEGASSGATPDPTGGATLSYSPTAQAAAGRPTPEWAKGDGQDVGLHRFYKGAFPTPKASIDTIITGLGNNVQAGAVPLPTRNPIKLPGLPVASESPQTKGG